MYLKLGEKATSFYDANSQLKVVIGQLVKVDDDKISQFKDITDAIRHGHLVKVDDEEEIEAFESGKPFEPKTREGDGENGGEDGDQELPEDLSTATVAQLRTYLIDNYEFDDEEIKEINKAKKDWLIAKIDELKDIE